MSAGTGSRCLFCGTTTGKRTREHVWRKALRTHFTPASSLSFWESSTSGEFLETRPISQFDMTLNAVCADCNSGWLNDLEDGAHPTLISLGRMDGGAPTRAQLSTFAFWAVVRALLRTHTSSGGRAPEYLFRAVYQARIAQLVPPGCVVLVAPTGPVDIEAGLHQSVVVNSEYLGHIAVSFDQLYVSAFLGGPGPLTSEFTARAAAQVRGWFPGTLWELAPNFGAHRFPPRYLTPEETKIAGSCLGFMLGRSVRDQFGAPLDLDLVVPASRRGDIPWPEMRAD